MRSVLARSTLAAGIAAALTGSGAMAAPTIFFGFDNNPNQVVPLAAHPNSDAARSAFLAALAGATVTTENFDGMSTGPLPSGPGTNDFSWALRPGLDVQVDNTTAPGATSGNYLRITAGTGSFDTFATSGANHFEALSGQGSTYFTAVFTQPLVGLGFYLTDPSDWRGFGGSIQQLLFTFGNAGGSTTMNLLSDGDPGTADLAPNDIFNGAVAFLGIVDFANPITTISLAAPSVNPDGDAVGFDDLTIATARQAAAPVPGSAFLAALGLGLMTLVTRRSKQS